jgi:hypothetical protein
MNTQSILRAKRKNIQKNDTQSTLNDNDAQFVKTAKDKEKENIHNINTRLILNIGNNLTTETFIRIYGLWHLSNK